MNVAGHAPHIHEVFCHPFSAGELVAQSTLGALRVNGETARASVADRLNDTTWIVRIEVGLAPATVVPERHLELVA